MPSVVELFKTYRTSPDPIKRNLAARTLLDVLYYAPMTARVLAKLLGPVVIVPIPKPWPGPDPAPVLDADFLREGGLIRIAMGDPNPQPSMISFAEQLKAATEFRSAMNNVIKALDGEIKRLEH